MNVLVRFRPVALAALLAATLLTGCAMKSNPHDAFMGDSLTEGWTLPTVNLGIHGQTTAQMLERFPKQVPGHGYGTVFILGGTNDVLLHVDPHVTVGNLEKMADLAQDAHIEPVLAEIPPIFRDNRSYLPAVNALNQEIIQLAGAKHLKLINYYGALIDHPDFESDGVHMKGRGYMMMDIALMRTKTPF
jgi:lysophospholipase L1-like esterase